LLDTCIMAGTALLALILTGVVAVGEVTTTPSPAPPADSTWVLIATFAIPLVCCALCLYSRDDAGDFECCWFPKTLFGEKEGRSRGGGGAQVSGASEDLRVGMLGTGGA